MRKSESVFEKRLEARNYNAIDIDIPHLATGD